MDDLAGSRRNGATRAKNRGFVVPTQPVATYHASGVAAPSWCPAAVQPPSNCSSVNPFGLDPTTYADIYQGSVGTVGQAQTLGPWGTLDQGGNVVEWTDTMTPPPAGINGGARLAPVARRDRQRARLPAVAFGRRPQPRGQPGLHRRSPTRGWGSASGVLGNLKVSRKSG